MKDLDPFVFIAVFEEMLGPALWLMAALAVIGVGVFLYVVARERKLMLRRFIMAELVGFAGALAAILLMWGVTHSSLSDAGGPIDWMLVLTIFAAGWAGALVLFYGMAGLFARRAAA
jgi:4-amino-4-deoxy-L-arabinose transferase-like glycosyltransferase